MANCFYGRIKQLYRFVLHFNLNFINIVCIAFMYLSFTFYNFMSYLPWSLTFFSWKLPSKKHLQKPIYFHYYFNFLAMGIKKTPMSCMQTFKKAFTVMSILFTTGFTNHDYMVLGFFLAVLVFLLA